MKWNTSITKIQTLIFEDMYSMIFNWPCPEKIGNYPRCIICESIDYHAGKFPKDLLQ